MDVSRFGLFVSLNPKKPLPVTRFGAGTLLASEIDPDNPRKVRHDTERVVAITREEVTQYGRCYRRCFENGELLKRTAADFEAFESKAAEAEQKRGEAVKAAKEKAKAEAKKAAKEAEEKAERERLEAERKAAEEKAKAEAEVIQPTVGEAPAGGHLPPFDPSVKPAKKGSTDGR